MDNGNHFTLLPENFQEEMVKCELEFQKNINETNIKRLLRIYTIGMQYYNIQEKSEFENYYHDKLKNLLLNEKVVKYLDTHEVDLTEKIDLDFLSNNTNSSFNNKNNPKKITLNSINNRLDVQKEDIMEYISRKLKEADIRIKSIEGQVSNSVVDQMANFESNKRQKEILTKEEIENDFGENNSNQNTNFSKISSGSFSSLDDENMERKRINSRRRNSIGQNGLLKQIEQFAEQNMNEMYTAIDDLKKSYETEINEALESGFTEIAESLKADLKSEIENLEAQYEEQKLKQVDLIRTNYVKKSSGVIV